MVQVGYNPDTVNWESQRKKAEGMTDTQLRGAIEDCLYCIGNGINEGKYLDQISIYRQELDRR
jgi:hypothetical protein